MDPARDPKDAAPEPERPEGQPEERPAADGARPELAPEAGEAGGARPTDLPVRYPRPLR